MRQSLRIRLWSLWNVPLLFLVGPAVLEVNERRSEVRIPLNWKTMRRDIGAMYFGVLCMGADIAGGLIAFDLIERRKENVSFIFKDFKAQFLKRATAIFWLWKVMRRSRTSWRNCALSISKCRRWRCCRPIWHRTKDSRAWNSTSRRRRISNCW